jgi:hypothetical protein
VRELEEHLRIPRIIVSQILTEDLSKKHVAAKLFPWFPSREQKEFRADVAQGFLETANSDPDFLKKFMTGDESWIYDYEPETETQSSQWKSPESPRQKTRQSRSNINRRSLHVRRRDKVVATSIAGVSTSEDATKS